MFIILLNIIQYKNILSIYSQSKNIFFIFINNDEKYYLREEIYQTFLSETPTHCSFFTISYYSTHLLISHIVYIVHFH